MLWVHAYGKKGVGMSLSKEVQTSRDSIVVEERGRMEGKGNGALGLFFKANVGVKHSLIASVSHASLSFPIAPLHYQSFIKSRSTGSDLFNVSDF